MNGRTYQIPGPRPITCSGGGGNTGGGGSNPTPTSSAGGSQPTGGNGGGNTGGSVPLYAQCGGNGYTGPTACAQGTCKAQNEWYSQCTP